MSRTYAEVIASMDLASGRPWNYADSAALVDFGDCARSEFHWADGAFQYMLHDTRQEAVEHLESLGFEVTA